MNDATVVSIAAWAAAAILFAVAVTLIGLDWFILSAASRVLRGKGMDPSLAALLETGCFLIPVGIAFAFLGGIAERWNGPFPENAQSYLTLAAMVDLMFLAPLLVIVPALLLALRARGRPSRSAGLRARRHNYRAWAVAFWIAAPVVSAFLWFVHLEHDFSTMLKIFSLLMMAGYGLQRLERQHGAQSVHLDPAAGPFVLYLRGFQIDDIPMLKVKENQSSWSDNQHRWLTLEQFLADEVEHRLGRFVALGSPQDVLPPGGATRVYMADESWQAEILTLMSYAKAILMQPSDTDAVRWELEAIREHGWLNRFFVITAPDQKKYRWLYQMECRLIRFQPVSWTMFTSRLHEAGIASGPDPGPGSVMGFNGTTVAPIATGLHDAASIIDTIESALPTSRPHQTAS